MKVTATVSFNRDVSKIKDSHLARRVEETIRRFEAAKSLSGIPGIKKLSGSANAYRIRIGDYRIGFYLSGTTIQLTILAHRREIYRKFPK